MKNKQVFINFENGKLTDQDGANILVPISLVAGSKQLIDFNFVTFIDGARNQVNLSDAVKWQCVVDNDLNINSDPMAFCKSTDAVTSAAVSGIIGFPIDCTTSGFIDKVNGKDTMKVWAEIYGLDNEDIPIYDYRFSVNACGTIITDHSEEQPEPPEEP